MKVSTEACILGAWVPNSNLDRVLDIGTGTGLLALMLAQRIDGSVDAIELDKNAANQAAKNMNESLWKDRVTVINRNVFEWTKETKQKYDLIVSNPPFFTNSLKSDSSQKNLAKHDTSEFNKKNLANVLQTLLSSEGKAYVLYPELEAEQFKKEVEGLGLFCVPALIIRNQPNTSIFRAISLVSKVPLSLEPEELNIREGQDHSSEFVNLLKPYYLKY